MVTSVEKMMEGKYRNGSAAAASPKLRKSFRGFLSAVKAAKDWRTAEQAKRRLEDEYGSTYVDWEPVTKSAMGETSGAVGGYTLPQDFYDHMLRAFSESTVFWPRATVVEMSGASAAGPYIDCQTTPSAAGISPFFGGLVGGWGFELHPAESEPAFRQQMLTAWDFIGYAVRSNQWFQDTPPGAQDKLLDLFADWATWNADYAFFQGIGANGKMPLGVINSPATILIDRAVSSQIAQADVANMSAKLLPYSWSRSIWAVSPSALVQLMQVTGWYSNTHTGLEKGSTEGQIVGWLNNRPVLATEKLPILGATGDLVLFDPSMYVIGDRAQVVVDVSGEVPNYFQKNQSVIRTWLRVDGRPILSNYVTLADNSSTASAYIALAVHS